MFMKKTTHDRILKAAVNEVKESLFDERSRIVTLNESLRDKTTEIEKLKQRIEELEGLFSKSDKNEVTIQISDDFSTLTPKVSWKKETTGKLIEAGVLNDVSATATATQLALMDIAREGLEQIIESFSVPVED